MKRILVPPALLAAVCALSGPAQAHHTAAMFDTTKDVTISGAVKTIKWQNPHVYLEVVSADGGKVWSIECSPPSILVRRGWSVHSIAAGDKVSVLGHPLRDGGPAAYMMNVTTKTGAVLKDHDY
ncbi:MAG TPA: DUF6152 family protein [Caulobacteraceae bacterium]|nr:DUF6152 family protein [Caulobacteraceae bacterium]